jgi:creatinine amidohydrolase
MQFLMVGHNALAFQQSFSMDRETYSPSLMSGKVLLWDMTSEEAGEAFREADFIVLPTASMEQHSSHLPLSTDSIRAEELTKYLALHAGGLRMVVLPTLVYGQSLHHIHFPGTITLREETYIQVLRDIAWSVKQHGGRRLLIINYHGGNIIPIELARMMIEREIGLKVYFVGWSSFAADLVKEWFPGVPHGHACYYETSMILHLRPDLVNREKMKRQRQRHEFQAPSRPLTRAPSAAYFEEQYLDGGIGDPTLARAELAEKLIPIVTERIVKALKEDMKLE